MTREFTIDPEDRSQVERLTRSLVDVGAIASTRVVLRAVDEVQAALRRIVAPPKPEQPTGLGAVVEDDRGDRWVFIADATRAHVRCWRQASDEIWRDYADINAVRILSPGVTA